MPETVIYADLDETLSRTDTLWESFLALLKRKPWMAVALPFWLLRGKAGFKQRLAASAGLDAEDLLFHDAVVDFLRTRRNEGSRIVLATAADRRIAQTVADRFGIFSDILASDGETNLIGMKKLAAIQRHAAGQPFEYVGDAMADLPIWEQCETAHVVCADPAFLQRIPSSVSIGQTFQPMRRSATTILRALRIKQWIKNLLLLVPLVLAHQVQNGIAVFAGAIAFFSFSLCASGVYLLNDLLDLHTDRRHPDKRHRPLADGSLSIPFGILLAVACLAGSLLLATLFLSTGFIVALGGYVLLNILYSYSLKRIIVIDVVILALFYAYRIVAGSIATNILITHWLLAFAVFFFLGLAILKRFTELRLFQRSATDAKKGGRGYQLEDTETLRALGINSGFLSLLILTFYLQSPDVTSLYPRPFLLWGVVLCLVYWIARLWLLAERGAIHDDPLIFTTKDRVSYITGSVILLMLIAASLPA